MKLLKIPLELCIAVISCIILISIAALTFTIVTTVMFVVFVIGCITGLAVEVERILFYNN